MRLRAVLPAKHQRLKTRGAECDAEGGCDFECVHSLVYMLVRAFVLHWSVHHHLTPHPTSFSPPGGRWEEGKRGEERGRQTDTVNSTHTHTHIYIHTNRHTYTHTPVRACPVVGEDARHDRMSRVRVQRCRPQVHTHAHTCTPHTQAHTQARDARAHEHTQARTQDRQIW